MCSSNDKKYIFPEDLVKVHAVFHYIYEDDKNKTIISHLRYISILTLLRRFRVKIVNFLSLFCLSIAKRDVNTKTTPNKDVCFESPGAMLEY